MHTSFWKYCLLLIRSQLTLEWNCLYQHAFCKTVPVSLKIRNKKNNSFSERTDAKFMFGCSKEKNFLFFSLKIINFFISHCWNFQSLSVKIKLQCTDLWWDYFISGRVCMMTVLSWQFLFLSGQRFFFHFFFFWGDVQAKDSHTNIVMQRTKWNISIRKRRNSYLLIFAASCKQMLIKYKLM